MILHALTFPVTRQARPNTYPALSLFYTLLEIIIYKMSIMFSHYKPIRKVFKEVMEKSSIIFPYHFYDLPPAGDYKECRFKAFYPLSYTAYLMPLVEISLGKGTG